MKLGPAELAIDDPAETGCRGFVLRIGKLRLSLTWPSRQPGDTL